MGKAKATARSTRNGRVLGEVDVEDFGDPESELGLFSTCESVADLRAVLREQVEVETSAMLELVAEADAFDVIELIRMREFSPVPDPRVTTPGGSAFAVEIVAAVLLSRSSRKPSDVPRAMTRPHEQVKELHARSKRLVRLALYRQQYEARLSDHKLAPLAAEYQGAVLTIRNLQYDHIRDDHERRLFRHPVVESLMRQYLGYVYDDVLRTRDALKAISGDRMTRLRDEVGDIMLQHRDFLPGEMPEDMIARFWEAMIPFMFLPAERATIYTTDVADAGQIDEQAVATVLASYSQTFDDSISAGSRVFEMLTGTNPFLTTPLIADGSGGFISTANDPGLDSLRRILESTLVPHKADMRRYDRQVRQPVSESLAIESVERILGCPAQHASFYYYAPSTPTALAHRVSCCRW